MKKLEIILGSIFLFGNIMMVLDIPGGMILASASVMLLYLLYFFCSFFLLNQKRLKDIFKRSTYSGIGAYLAIMSIIIGWALSAFIAGVLFIILQWPGGRFLLSCGLIWLFFCGIVLLFVMQRHKKFVLTCFKRIGIVIFVGFFALMIGIFRMPQISGM